MPTEYKTSYVLASWKYEDNFRWRGLASDLADQLREELNKSALDGWELASTMPLAGHEGGTTGTIIAYRRQC
jgi:hypothetical protein